MSIRISHKIIDKAIEKDTDTEIFFMDYTSRFSDYLIDFTKVPTSVLKSIYECYKEMIDKDTKDDKFTTAEIKGDVQIEDQKKREKLWGVRKFKEFELEYKKSISKAKPTSLYQMSAKLKTFFEENLTTSKYVYMHNSKIDMYMPYVLKKIEYYAKGEVTDLARIDITLIYNDKNSTREHTVEVFTNDFHLAKRDLKVLLENLNIYLEKAEYLKQYKKELAVYEERATWQNLQIVFGGVKYIVDNVHHLETADKNETSYRSRGSRSVEVSLYCRSQFSTDEENSTVPYHFNIYAFNLKNHKFEWINSIGVELYVYNKEIEKKLILPQSHKDLIDILLTADIKELGGDIIENKGDGTFILTKGASGLGKTLTAEIFSEKKELPLYSIHAGDLGINGAEIEERLTVCFERAERWGCILLIDESDTYIRKRTDDVNHNAIVATFLRLIEYYSGLLFATTNRVDDVDTAIESRASAILTYASPDKEQIIQLWELYCNQYNLEYTDKLISKLSEEMKFAGRDIKNICALVSRYSQGKKVDKVDFEMFKQCATFRGLYVIGDKDKK
jgi:ATPase family associated with various cellular activities (AAA)